MNRRAFIIAVSALLVISPSESKAAELCDSHILRLIDASGQPLVETAQVFGCQRNAAAGFEYGLIRSTQTDILYEAIGFEALALIESIDRMSMDGQFALRYDRSKSEIITLGRYNRASHKFVGDEPIMLHENWMNNVRNFYFDNFQAYALANRLEEVDLWDYMEWFVLRRDVTLDVLSANMNPMAAAGFKDSYNYGFLPWPWQLTHAKSMESYLDERATQRQSRVPM